MVSAQDVRSLGVRPSAGPIEGLIHGAWNIRLLPHYALGVFFILAHLASGLRVVITAHHVNVAIANREGLMSMLDASMREVGLSQG